MQRPQARHGFQFDEHSALDYKIDLLAGNGPLLDTSPVIGFFALERQYHFD